MKRDSASMKAQGEMYDILMVLREHRRKPINSHLTQAALQLLEILEGVASCACDAHRADGIIDVHIDIYAPTTLPGFRVGNDGIVRPPDEGGLNDDSFGGIPIE